jgi:hypothetical protein
MQMFRTKKLWCKFTATFPNWAIVATAGLDGVDLFEPMLVI